MSTSTGKIEITQSTLLKLLVRRGSNTERQNITLSEGELGYTIDTQRLFIGDSYTAGGIPVTTKTYYGTTPPTSYSAALPGDYSYDTAVGGMYYKDSQNNWNLVAGPVANRVDGATLLLSTFNSVQNVLMVGVVSGANIDRGFAGTGIEFNGDAIQVKADQSLNSITPRTQSYLQLPNNIQFGTPGGATVYNFPSFDGPNGYSLVTNGNGVITWRPGNAITQYQVLSGNQIPVGTIVQYGSGGSFGSVTSAFQVPYGYFKCDGQTCSSIDFPELYGSIGTFYGTTTAANTFKLPSLSASNVVYLIKYLEDQVFGTTTFNILNSLSAYNTNTGVYVSSITVPNSGLNYTLYVPDYISKSYTHTNFLPISGGSITGSLVTQNGLSAYNGLVVNSGNLIVSAGSVYVQGDVVAYYTSDRRLKDDIAVLEDCLSKINRVSGVSFTWNDKQDIHQGRDVGVIAQEIQEILPEAVIERSNGYKAVSYEKIIPLLIESIKELSAKVEYLTTCLRQ